MPLSSINKAKSSSGGGGVTSASELDTVDTYGLIGDPESAVILQPLIDNIVDVVINKLLTMTRFNQHISPGSTDHLILKLLTILISCIKARVQKYQYLITLKK